MNVEFIGILVFLIVLAMVGLWWPLRREKKIGLYVLALPLLAGGLYFYFGNAHELFSYWREQRAQAELQQLSPQQIVVRMRQYLQQHPQQARAWYLLGKLYLGQGDYQQAYQAFRRAQKLQPRNNEIALFVLQASFFKRGQTLTQRERQSLQKLSRIDQTHVGALNLLALDAYRQHQYRKAIHYWRDLLNYFPNNSRDRRVLLNMIVQAEKKKIPLAAAAAK